ncbi:MAG: radical SAM protein [Candidatus Izemoplasmatales bacterium]|nr:radical SAM protein [Candidatus Izemoplasmatales bacterium]
MNKLFFQENKNVIQLKQVVFMSSYAELKAKIIQVASLNHTPVVGEFELTSQCNFSCPMCYVKDNRVKNELSTDEWKSLFEEAVNVGLVFGLLTGGEALLRPDFCELYAFLHDRGVRLTVYTNGYHIRDEHIEAFKKRPPDFVAITLYGKNDATYHQVTGMNDGFSRVKANILRLKEHKIPVVVRVIPIPEVYKDLDDILTFTHEHSLPLGYFLYIAPSIHTDHLHRLTPSELVDFEDKILKMQGKDRSSVNREFDCTKTCAAFKSGYAINHLGYMQPCTLLGIPQKKVEPNAFLETFLHLSETWDNLDTCQDCRECALNTTCIPCKARLYYEGSLKNCAPYLRAFAQKRRDLK